MSQGKQNIRIRFGKQGDIRFISHHDLMRLFERALRRADLPVAMTEGFNPRPRISFPIPLSVGHTGASEVVDVVLHGWLRPEEVLSRLQAQLPDGVVLKGAEIIGSRARRQPTGLSYRVPLLSGHSLTPQRVQRFLDSREVVVERPRKGLVEIRQFVQAIRLEPAAVQLLLRYTERGTARPEEVLQALGCREGADYLRGELERTHVHLPTAG